MDIAYAIHCAMVRGCNALATQRPQYALAYHAIPWLVDAVFLAYFVLTAWFGLRVQCEMLGMVTRKNLESPKALQPGDPRFTPPRKQLDDGSIIEARFSPRGELLHYEPVRYGESVASVVTTSRQQR
jgi:hypothetical protein